MIRRPPRSTRKESSAASDVYKRQEPNRPIHSIFFGGGTPSLFSPKALDTLIKKLENTFGLGKDCEITIEANPGTIDKEHFYG